MGDDGYNESTLAYIYKSGNIIDVKDFKQIIIEGLSKKAGEKVMGYGEQLRAEGVEQGLKQGLRQGTEAVALNLLNDGMPVEKVIKFTGLSEAAIINLQNNSSCFS